MKLFSKFFGSKDTMPGKDIMPGKDMNNPYCKVCARFIPERFSPEALAEVIDTILAQSGMRSGVEDYNANTCCYLCKKALQRN